MRLLNGTDSGHVLEAIFKGLGAALAEAFEANGGAGGEREARRPHRGRPAPFQGAPYWQAIAAGGFVFVSGQLGLKPGDSEISGAIEEQTSRSSRTCRRSSRRPAAGLTGS